MNILFTICGRAGSKGFKNKNLKYFLGIPLSYYSLAVIYLYKQRHDSEDKIDVVVNTDSDDLIHMIQDQTILEVNIINRDIALGGDLVPKVAVIADCLYQMEKRQRDSYDLVIDLDITSPLRTVDDIENAVKRKRTRQDTDVVYSVTGARRNPYFNMVREENGYFVRAVSSDYTTRQQAPAFYDMNASIYAYSPDALKTKDAKNFFNDRCDAVIMADTGILDIDSEEDFELMQIIARHLIQKDEKMREINEIAKKMNGYL